MALLKQFSLFLFFLSFVFSSFAQDFDPKAIKNVKKEKRTFVFSKLTIDDKQYKKKKKKEKQKQLNELKEIYNQHIEDVLSKYWQLQEPYLVLSPEEAYEYVKKNKNSAISVDLVSYPMEEDIVLSSFRVIAVKGLLLNKVERLMHIALSKEISITDLVYGINTIQSIYSDVEKYNSKWLLKKARKKNGHLLAKKTLLLPKELLHKKLTKSVLKEIYPYPFEIVTKAEIEKAILTMDENYLILYDAQQGITSRISGIAQVKVTPLWVLYNTIDGTTVNLVYGFLDVKETFSSSSICTFKKLDVKNLLKGM